MSIDGDISNSQNKIREARNNISKNYRLLSSDVENVSDWWHCRGARMFKSEFKDIDRKMKNLLSELTDLDEDMTALASFIERADEDKKMNKKK